MKLFQNSRISRNVFLFSCRCYIKYWTVFSESPSAVINSEIHIYMPHTQRKLHHHPLHPLSPRNPCQPELRSYDATSTKLKRVWGNRTVSQTREDEASAVSSPLCDKLPGFEAFWAIFWYFEVILWNINSILRPLIEPWWHYMGSKYYKIVSKHIKYHIDASKYCNMSY